MLLDVKYAFLHLEQCFGSLSCWNRYTEAKTSFVNGSNVAFKIEVYLVAVVIPVKITTLIASRFEMPPQMCTLTGYLGHGFSLRGAPFLQ